MAANGQLPASSLVTVQGSMQLNPGTAAAWNAMKAGAAASGVSLTIAGPAGAYRSLFVQQDMINNPGAYNVTPGITLAPAGKSSHGWGDRLDVGSGNSWAISHCSNYGFIREFGATDPNHYQYLGPSGTTPTPISNSQIEETEMYYMVSSASADGVVQPGAYVQNADGPVRRLSNHEWTARQNAQPGVYTENWAGFDMRQLVKIVGLREFGPEQGLTNSYGQGLIGTGRLSGNIIY